METQTLIGILSGVGTILGVIVSFIFTLRQTRKKDPAVEFVDLTLDNPWGKLEKE